MTQKEIQDLIKYVSKSGVTEVEIEKKDFKITIKSQTKETEEKTVYIQQPPVQQIAQPAIPASAPQPSAPQPSTTGTAVEESAPAPEADNSKYVTIKSPMIGTFYRSPDPEKPVFVEVGDTIKAGDTICIIEAMKLFNEIEAEISGKIVKVLADDSSPVEYDQPLFLVDPS